MVTNPTDTALLVIDVQTGLFHKSIPIYKAKELLENIRKLIDRARQASSPVIYIQHSNDTFLAKGSADWQLHHQLSPLEDDIIIHKRHPSSFQDTKLADLLAEKNIHRLVITGLVTHGCVKATGLDAIQRGYQVILVSDGHSSYSKDASRLIGEWNKKLGGKGAEIKRTVEVQFGD
jgi:nicotinamidase-related amidase